MKPHVFLMSEHWNRSVVGGRRWNGRSWCLVPSSARKCPDAQKAHSLQPLMQDSRRYRLLEAIGTGATSRVHMCVDKGGNVRAVKRSPDSRRCAGGSEHMCLSQWACGSKRNLIRIEKLNQDQDKI